jgi:hypothetical protein
MPHYYIHNISHATPLLEAIQRYLLGSFYALLGRGPNAGDAFSSLCALFGFGRNCNGDVGNASAGNACTSDANAGDLRTGGGRALTSLFESDNSPSLLPLLQVVPSPLPLPLPSLLPLPALQRVPTLSLTLNQRTLLE